MSCYCDYDEMPKLYNESFVIARKDHKCCECYQQIKKGDEYQVITGLWDERFDRFKTCEKCADLRDALKDVVCVSIEGLKEEYVNYLDYIGAVKYDEKNDEYIYPKNHFKLGNRG